MNRLLERGVQSCLLIIGLSLSGCGGRSLSSIEVTPGAPSIFVGATVQLTATAHYSDQSTANVTSTVYWTAQTITDADIARPNASGLVTASEPGDSRIYASISLDNTGRPAGVQTMVVVTVTAPHPS